MARRRRAPKRKIIPDVKYGSEVVSKFISSLMHDGKRSTAESIFYGALERIAKKTQQEPLKFFTDALDKLRPSVEVRSRRVGGATFQIPMEIRPERANTLVRAWIIGCARKRRGETMADRLADEFIDIIHSKGGAVRKSEENKRAVESNRAHSHYRIN